MFPQSMGWIHIYWVSSILMAPITSNAQANNLCNRLYVHGLDWTNIPYTFIFQGIYELQSYEWDNFPVFVNEHGFFLHYDRPSKLLLLGQEKGSYFMGATLLSYVDPEGDNWINEGNQPFKRLTDRWFFWDAAKQQRVFLQPADSAKLECAEQSLFPCRTGMIYFNESIVQENQNGELITISLPTREYYMRVLPEVYMTLRPVYELIHPDGNTGVYLFFAENIWLVGQNYTVAAGFVRSLDTALRPELIRASWEIYMPKSGWQAMTSLALMCKGVSSNETSGATDNITSCRNDSVRMCQNNGTCTMNGLDETVCVCEPGYEGVYCQERLPMCTDRPADSGVPDYSIGYVAQDFFRGAVAAHICAKGYAPSFVFSICRKTSTNPGTPLEWHTTGTCEPIPTTTALTTRVTPKHAGKTTTHRYTKFIPQTTTTRYYSDAEENKFNFDNHELSWLRLVILILAPVIQVIVPLMALWWIRDHVEEKADDIEHEANGKKINFESELLSQENIIKFEKYPDYSDLPLNEQPPEMRAELAAVQETHEKKLAYLSMQKEEKMSEGCFGDFSALRFLSTFYYISLWLWLLYMVGCGATHCTQYGYFFTELTIMAVVFSFLCQLFILIECGFSRERKYIKNLGDTKSLSKIISGMRDLAPSICMAAEAWHYELRVRTVTYTDANGYLQTRTETYNEKVVTHIEVEPFVYGYWIDDSAKTIDGIKTSGVTKITLSKDISMGDPVTKLTFDNQYSEFRNATENLDEYVDHQVLMEVPGFEKRLTVFLDEKTVPWWINECTFWVASVFLFTWPYRILFHKNVGSASFLVKKRVFMERPEDTDVQLAPPRESMILDYPENKTEESNTENSGADATQNVAAPHKKSKTKPDAVTIELE